ncbi:dihydrofolate reductase [Apibacter muscae]|nr:dihydrofolate reductase [Apibacter muscae]
MTIIVAMDENQAIGGNNQLLWHLPSDLKHFKKLTQNHVVIMGRKTYESLGKPLPNRTNVVITSNPKFKAVEDVIIHHSIKEALQFAKSKDDNPFIIGGGILYKETLNLVDNLEITLVETKIDQADTYFPSIDYSQWKKTKEEFHPMDEKHSYSFRFISFEKK